ncbi:hypothetical protein C8J57DRAFT_1234803 [Mycena rebaudengoi]|nr:hypothetical protein C8J57DRAFT_1234803 [Mycena rebaudengoi]
MTLLDKSFTGKTVSVHNKNQAVELPLNGRDGRFSTGRKTTNPYRDRQFKIFEKSSTGRARHPVDGCRRAVATATGGSPKATEAAGAAARRRLATRGIGQECLGYESFDVLRSDGLKSSRASAKMWRGSNNLKNLVLIDARTWI